MPIQIACPSCARELRVPDGLIGKQVRCPSCQTTFTAQASEQPQEGTEEQTSDKYSRTPPAQQPPEQTEEPPVEEDYETPSRRRRRSSEDDDFTQRRPHRGALVLTLGIVSVVVPVLGIPTVFCCSGLGPLLSGAVALATGLPAFLLGQSDLKAMSKGEMDRSGEGMTKGGWICGIIGTALGALELLCGGGLLILLVVMAATGNVK